MSSTDLFTEVRPCCCCCSNGCTAGLAPVLVAIEPMLIPPKMLLERCAATWIEAGCETLARVVGGAEVTAARVDASSSCPSRPRFWRDFSAVWPSLPVTVAIGATMGAASLAGRWRDDAGIDRAAELVRGAGAKRGSSLPFLPLSYT